MAHLKRIPVQFADKFRLWQELVLAAERQGVLFLPTDGEAQPGEECEIDVRLGGAAEPVTTLRARVEAFRPASLRFSRGITVRVAPADLERVRGLIGALPTDPSGSAGRLERRWRVRWPLWFRTPAILRRCLTVDVSDGGMQAEMPERVRRGHIVEFTLLTPQGHELMMAGEVQWTSETEKRIGVRFLFQDGEAAAAFGALLKHAVRAMGERARSGTVLIVDGDVDAREFAIAALAARGYRVLWTSTAEEALSLLREERPDLVLLDATGHRLDGPSWVRAVKADRELCDVPLVLVAAEVDPDVVAEYAALGLAEWLAKPVQLRTLVSTVSRHLDEPAAA